MSENEELSLEAGHAPRERVSWNRRHFRIVQIFIGHAPRERVSWNPCQTGIHHQFAVTLHVSVWVEICLFTLCMNCIWSRSTWACELKFKKVCYNKRAKCHAPRERVSWNFVSCMIVPLKLPGHAPRERVSWNSFKAFSFSGFIGHAPRERVSWNIHLYPPLSAVRVTLHVSVWVEMANVTATLVRCLVTLHVSVWVEIFLMFFPFLSVMSRSTWACELKWCRDRVQQR